ncbi:unnamed protein product [Bursaphelenchus xylophilus]|uniref:(pine wood nematode) hypothetical protein n=1 Tax=Bursaphelenchus xylophilus TaxID=6326 RepID=A0A1I7RKA0_BURXY|nr:unnamed protein product [Bursaphelenchus xylophilus]CAG9131406.1 unnamed protein product [Bursaphelenchus xylophilus]
MNNNDLIDCRHLVFYEYKRGSTPTQCLRNINGVFGEKTVGFSTVFRWYQKFQKGDWDLSVKPKTKTSKFSVLARKRLLDLIKERPQISVAELSEQLCICLVALERELQKMNIFKVKDKWVHYVDMTHESSQGSEENVAPAKK